MAKKKENYHPHNIVFFKAKDDVREKEIYKYSFEKIDQEDKVKLTTDFRPFSGNFQYSILISNQSLAPITEMKIKIKFPEFLTISRYFPLSISIPRIITESGVNQINLEFDELNEKSNKQIHLHFTPNSLENIGEIRTIVTYVNNKDTIRVLDSRPTDISIDKVIIEPIVVPSSFIREFTQHPEVKKAIKSMGVERVHPVDSETIYEILEQLFLNYNFQLVAKDVAKRILWYYGTESNIKQDVLVIGQIVSNKIEIIASSLNHFMLVSFLAQVSNDFKDYLIVNKIINSKDQVHDLDCKNCGAALSYFPKKNESIRCMNCNYEQIIW
jgi:hypothetical protein